MTATLSVPARELSRSAGIELGWYRGEHVAERVRRAHEREGTESLERLIELLRKDGKARTRFRRSIAVPVSGLFRDPEQFRLLERELLPSLLADGRRLPALSAGCADGSELYTLGMILGDAGALERSFLLGSDLLAENIEAARRGVYHGITVPAKLRASARWETRDLVRDGAAPGKWRLILCRNVAIYLAGEPKRRLHASLAAALANGGVLVLGRSERLLDSRRLGLEEVGPHAYRKVAA